MTQQTALRVIERNAGFVAGSFNTKYKQWSVRKISLLQQNYVLLYNGELSTRCTIHTRHLSNYLLIKEGDYIFMTTIKVKENEPFEVAMRRFKRTIEKTGLLTELRAREFYEKPTAERKRKLAAAVKRTYKRLRSQLLPPKLY